MAPDRGASLVMAVGTGEPDGNASRVSREVLLVDYQLQNENLQNQYTRMHQRLQLVVALNTALLAAAAALAEDGHFLRWLLLIPAAGVVLSSVGFVMGREDRKLVVRYHNQIAEAAGLLAGDAAVPAGERWLHAGIDTDELRKAFPDTGSSFSPVSATRLPVLFGALFTLIWLAIAVLMVGSLEWW